MKTFLLLIVGFFILVALFGDGGLEVSPALTTDVAAQLEFSPNVSYAPQTTNVETQRNTYIDTNVEHQTVIVQPAAHHGHTGGVTVVDIPAHEQVACAPGPGEVVEMAGGMGVCFIRDAAGQRWLQNPRGERTALCNGPIATNCNPSQPLPTPTINQEPLAIITLLPSQEPSAIITPLAPVVPGSSLEQLQAAFLRNGGELPWYWEFNDADDKMKWLKRQGETWK